MDHHNAPISTIVFNQQDVPLFEANITYTLYATDEEGNLRLRGEHERERLLCFLAIADIIYFQGRLQGSSLPLAIKICEGSLSEEDQDLIRQGTANIFDRQGEIHLGLEFTLEGHVVVLSH